MIKPIDVLFVCRKIMNRTKIAFLFICCSFVANVLCAQEKPKSYNDDESELLLKNVAAKYGAYKNIKADFQLLAIQPKVKPTDNEAKLTDTIKGTITLAGEKFRISMKGQEIFCDGKNLWTYSPADKEVQISLFEETDEVFSPSKIFSFYRDGYSHQMRERKTFAGKKVAVVELSPINKKVSYFKIDAGFDAVTFNLLEAKVYSKNGARYVYQILKEKINQEVITDFFTFDSKKFPGVHVEDLR
jgi:outer membrane lipoprotein carrier protein